MTELEDACVALAGDALHYMSLGSKELFHSNFLGWYCGTYPDLGAGTFRDVVGVGTPGDGPVVEREKSHLDLVLRLPGLRSAVIENKVWSLPDDSQLERYAEGPIAKLSSDPALILLSLTPPLWDGPTRVFGGATWRYVGYEDLAERLVVASTELSTGARADDRFAGELIGRYAQMIGHLHRVVSATTANDPHDPVWMDEETFKLLERVRIHDGLAKLRAHRAVAYLIDCLSGEGTVSGHASLDETRAAGMHVGTGWKYVKIGGRVAGLEVGFSNGVPLLSGMVRLESGDSLWWQYQGPAWRLAVVSAVHVGRGDDLRARRHEYIERTYKDWFDFDGVADVLGKNRASPVPVRGGDSFHRYDPDFAYRYAKVDIGRTQVNLGELAKLTSYYLNKAATWT